MYGQNHIQKVVYVCVGIYMYTSAFMPPQVAEWGREKKPTFSDRSFSWIACYMETCYWSVLIIVQKVLWNWPLHPLRFLSLLSLSQNTTRPSHLKARWTVSCQGLHLIISSCRLDTKPWHLTPSVLAKVQTKTAWLYFIWLLLNSSQLNFGKDFYSYLFWIKINFNKPLFIEWVNSESSTALWGNFNRNF